jgi:hypothetical protein
MKNNTFYEQVLEEYLPECNLSPFICDVSPTFKTAFSEEKTKSLIRKHAEEFVKETSVNTFLDDLVFLFYETSEEDDTDEKHCEVRINFLNWCIKNNLTV